MTILHVSIGFMSNRIVSATEFKAKCLALLDEVAEQSNTITITKRGKAVATLGAAKKTKWRSPMGVLAGKVEIVGDIISPAEEWEVETDPDRVLDPTGKP